MVNNDGGPAFPFVVRNDEDAFESGMTLRDYFAAKFMDVAASNETNYPTGTGGVASYDGIAKRCYFMADAMLKARNA